MLEEFKNRIREFTKERDWDQFHSPKNLSMALAGEVGELLEHFQWLTEEQSKSLDPDKQKEVAEELADILIYLIRTADKLDVDLPSAVDAKIEENERRYPADRARGSSAKYDRYE